MEFLGHPHLVCLTCRRSKKLMSYRPKAVPCAECGAALYNIGKLFAAPRRDDDAGWRKLEWMFANGWNGYNWPVTPQMSLREVQEAVRTGRENVAASRRITNMRQGIERRQKLARHRAKATLKQQRQEEERQRLYQEQVLERVARANQTAAEV